VTKRATPSSLGWVSMMEGGSLRSSLWGGAAFDDVMFFSRNTRMMVIMSSIAVMLRKSISGSLAFLRIALRSAALNLMGEA
jgi:hypothetical protein